jgi:uncharacterized protein YecE (DUF72 family)
LQLPPNLPSRLGDLAATLEAFGAGCRVAVELRHPSWLTDDTRRLLEEHDSALCWADSPSMKTPQWRTASWGYVRLHEGRARPRPCYGRQALRSWAARLKDLFGPAEDVFVYFNNDTAACAPANARQLRDLLARAGVASP